MAARGGTRGKKRFFGDRVPPLYKGRDDRPPPPPSIISRSGFGTADEVKNSKTISTSKLNSEEVISY